MVERTKRTTVEGKLAALRRYIDCKDAAGTPSTRNLRRIPSMIKQIEDIMAQLEQATYDRVGKEKD